jgi:hypothetical protein
MQGSGGITETIPDIVAGFGGKDTVARLIHERDPEQLIDQLIKTYTAEHYKRPSCFCNDSLPVA